MLIYYIYRTGDRSGSHVVGCACFFSCGGWLWLGWWLGWCGSGLVARLAAVLVPFCGSEAARHSRPCHHAMGRAWARRRGPPPPIVQSTNRPAQPEKKREAPTPELPRPPVPQRSNKWTRKRKEISLALNGPPCPVATRSVAGLKERHSSDFVSPLRIIVEER